MPTPSQTEVRFLIDSDFLETLKNRLGKSKATDIMRAALTLLDWATEEAEQGRVILSATEQGGDIHRLVMPELAHPKSSAATLKTLIGPE
jgi:hypothetical protein